MSSLSHRRNGEWFHHHTERQSAVHRLNPERNTTDSSRHAIITSVATNDMRVHITARSGNAKTGPIPVTTTERASCPTTCPFYDKGCYAKSGPLALHWRKVSDGERGTDWQG